MVSRISNTIYTLGTSTRTIAEFIGLLQHLGVEVAVDVRRFPYSRFEHFRQNSLAISLPEAGIRYCHLGEELGGYRKGGYEAFMNSQEFKEGLARLEEIAGSATAAIFCAELLPWRCHRRFIGAELEKRGWRVTHVIDEKRNWTPRS